MSPKIKTDPDIFERVTKGVGSSVSFVLHTLIFIGAFVVGWLGIASWNTVLLVLTTVVSLEAIYLSIFIQMTVNRQSAELAEVSEDVDEIQEDIEEISEEDTDGDGHEEKIKQHLITLESLTVDVKRVLADLEALKKDR